jgi:hypothetical protein
MRNKRTIKLYDDRDHCDAATESDAAMPGMRQRNTKRPIFRWH